MFNIEIVTIRTDLKKHDVLLWNGTEFTQTENYDLNCPVLPNAWQYSDNP